MPVCGVICNYQRVCDVQWQDGSIEKDIRALDLFVYDSPMVCCGLADRTTAAITIITIIVRIVRITRIIIIIMKMIIVISIIIIII